MTFRSTSGIEIYHLYAEVERALTRVKERELNAVFSATVPLKTAALSTFAWILNPEISYKTAEIRLSESEPKTIA